MYTTSRLTFLLAACVVVSALPLLARSYPRQGPGVARVSLLQGDVSLLRAGAQSWDAVSLNAPLVDGDEIYVAPNGRSELEFDAADVLRLADGANVKIAAFAGRRLQLQLVAGTVSLTTVGRSFLDTEIDTPNMSVRPLHSGTLRIDVVDSDHTSVVVRGGSAEVFTRQGQVEVRNGEQIEISGSKAAQYRVSQAPTRDAWDQWVHDREQRVEDARSYRYTGRDMDGVEDLDSYGNWIDVPNYGAVWRPIGVMSDWSPYYYGRWVWTPFYGWTWTSYEPWGWAPYHYGRWVYDDGIGWGWWPGRLGYPHYWAPAYVSFFIGGANWGGGFGFGDYGVGWVPLAPYESYYGYSQINYITTVNNVTVVNNNTTINNVQGFANVNGVKTMNGVPLEQLSGVGQLRNIHAPGGVVGISADEFARGRVDQHGRILTPHDLIGVHAVKGMAPVVPTPASLNPLPNVAVSRIPVPPARGRDPEIFTHRTLPPQMGTPTMGQIGQAVIQARVQAGLGAPGTGTPGYGSPGIVARATPANSGVRMAHGGQRVMPPSSVVNTPDNSGVRMARSDENGGRHYELINPTAPAAAVSHSGQPLPGGRLGEGESGLSGWHRFGVPEGQSVSSGAIQGSGSGSNSVPDRSSGYGLGRVRHDEENPVRRVAPVGGESQDPFHNHPLGGGPSGVSSGSPTGTPGVSRVEDGGNRQSYGELNPSRGYGNGGAVTPPRIYTPPAEQGGGHSYSPPPRSEDGGNRPSYGERSPAYHGGYGSGGGNMPAPRVYSPPPSSSGGHSYSPPPSSGGHSYSPPPRVEPPAPRERSTPTAHIH